MAPIFLIPPLALFMAANHFRAFWSADIYNPSKMMWLAKGIVELFFAGIYTWLIVAPVEFNQSRADIVRWGVVVLFGTNVLAILIEKYIVFNFVQWVKNLKIPRKNA